jgi:hypothetical protein
MKGRVKASKWARFGARRGSPVPHSLEARYTADPKPAHTPRCPDLQPESQFVQHG